MNNNNLLRAISIILVIIISIFTPSSSHFFPNISSIPPSLTPNKTLWQDFKNFTGCHKGIKQDGLNKVKKYFQYFGYLNNSYNDFSDEFDGNFESAVKTYQLNFNLNTTGELDEMTMNRIVQPRCGNPDIVNGTTTMYRPPYSANSTIHTVAHYSFFPNRPRWPSRRTQLTYNFANELTDVVRSVFARAFERWSEVTPMNFTETTASQADIRIGFFSRDHGDGEPFDGLLGTLAHAFAPPVGIFHLDGDENWVINGAFTDASQVSAIDLESVAVHEIGHLLGLGHSSYEEAIMYPTISSGIRKVELANDDIAGIQELYGANPNYNGSGTTLTPRGERDMNGAPEMRRSFWGIGMLLVVGLFYI